MAQATCPTCGTHFESANLGRRTKRYCTESCRKRAEYHRWRRRKGTLTACVQCGATFKGVRGHGGGPQRYCSKACVGKANQQRLRTTRQCATDGCTTHPTRGKEQRWCEFCYAERQAALAERRRQRNQRTWYAGNCIRCGTPFVFNQPQNQTCSARCADAYHRDKRRAHKRNAYVEDVWRSKVYERDGWHCRLCGKPVERDAEVPHPLAPTLDHIVPLSLGGEHSYANVQLAHHSCNWKKGATMPDTTQLLLAAA